MSLRRMSPPIDYLSSASRTSLESFELSRLNHAANLRREIATLIDQWIEETAEAMLARWMLEHHTMLHQSQPSTAELLRTFENPPTGPLPSFPEVSLEVAPAPPTYAQSKENVSPLKATKKRA
jgi:hypothetical protein